MVLLRGGSSRNRLRSLCGLLEDLERGQGPNQIGRPASAYFEQEPLNLDELRFESKRNDAGKIPAGVVGGKIIEGKRLADGRRSFWVSGGTLLGIGCDRHAAVIAGSRGGKGRSFLVPILLTYPVHGSIKSVDPKGDHARLTARYRAEVLGQRVAVLDPDGVSGESTLPYRVSFNPLSMLSGCDEGQVISDARLIAGALIPSGQERDPHWSDSSRGILGSGLIPHVATCPGYEGRRNLVTVFELASRLLEPDPDDDQRFRLEVEMKSNGFGGGVIQAAAAAFFDKTGGELSSVLSTLRKSLAWIGAPRVRAMLEGPSIDLADLKRDSLALYVCVPAMRMSEMSGWIRMLVELSLAACERTPFSSPRPSVLFLLDELPVISPLDSIEKAAGLMAGFGVRLVFVCQDLSQLKVYRSWETILGNCGSIHAFSNVDLTTLDYLSKQLGSTQVATPSHSAQAYGAAARNGAGSDSWSIGSHPLLAPEEIARVFRRDDHLLRQLVLRPGHRPLILQRAFYDKHELFRNRT